MALGASYQAESGDLAAGPMPLHKAGQARRLTRPEPTTDRPTAPPFGLVLLSMLRNQRPDADPGGVARARPIPILIRVHLFPARWKLKMAEGGISGGMGGT